MNQNAPLPLAHLTASRPRVLTLAQLREHGVSAAEAAGRPWQQVLPGVFLLHSGPATSEERLHAALLYAGRRGGEAMITGLAALALYRFSAAPALLGLAHIDVLVPGTRRLRSTGDVRIVRAHTPPRPLEVTGLPVAPVARAVADAVAQLSDADTVRRLLSEAVRSGHCEPAAVVRELTVARLLNRPHVVDAVEALLAEGRAIAEDRLYQLVRGYELPEPVWNVDLRLPGGPHLGGVDAYWPEQAVAIEIDTRAPRQGEDEDWAEAVRKRETLERLGVTVLHLTPRKLRDWPEQQAAVVRTALTASADREPAAYLVVLPR
ncbi:hypothetical protein ACFZBM_15250 [Streptomyces lavendulae]|uniref:hypothetical protein n=1 Tax=Streptomyces lavendulae TaxID=1914 RepID=UPI0024A5CDBE|nr:hypothetical protein [Streptomyces lavendulae]GLV81564.1 hypothetical protein Slala03_12530 [Streptomyces lavendulae subsp. lavendulae]GLV96999.1 hypothetical protein Slala05_06310 [Streptomyces lavendulae subsp. lavendulae]GLX37247.1 hypothetical protein Sros01_33200 [Streptomyces roseochromogenus]